MESARLLYALLPASEFPVGGAGLVMGEDVIHHLVSGGEGQTHIAVRRAVVDGDAELAAAAAQWMKV